jgi:hypothetical protein
MAKKQQDQQDQQEPTRAVKVRARTRGYFGHMRRYPGDVFIVPSAQVSTRWMERVADDTPLSMSTGRDRLAEEQQGIRRTKLKPGSRRGLAPNPGARVRFSDTEDDIEFREVAESALSASDADPLGVGD